MYWTLKYFSPSFRVFLTNNLTLRKKPSASVFMPTTFAIGHWLWLLSVFSRTISRFWKCLCFLFHLWWDWGDHRNSFHHLTQNLLAICCIHLHLFLLHSSAFTKWPDCGKTALDFMVRMLLGHIGCSLCTSPNFCQRPSLQSLLSLTEVSSVIHHLEIFHVCGTKTSVLFMSTDFVFPKHQPYGLMLGGSCAN